MRFRLARSRLDLRGDDVCDVVDSDGVIPSSGSLSASNETALSLAPVKFIGVDCFRRGSVVVVGINGIVGQLVFIIGELIHGVMVPRSMIVPRGTRVPRGAKVPRDTMVGGDKVAVAARHILTVVVTGCRCRERQSVLHCYHVSHCYRRGDCHWWAKG